LYTDRDAYVDGQLPGVEARPIQPAATVPSSEFPILPTIGQAVREEEKGRAANNGGETSTVAEADRHRTSEEPAELDESANFCTPSPLTHRAEEIYKQQTGGLEREGSEPVLPDVNEIEQEYYKDKLRKRLQHPQEPNAGTSSIGYSRKRRLKEGSEESSPAGLQAGSTTSKEIGEIREPEGAASPSPLPSTIAPNRIQLAKLTPGHATEESLTTKSIPNKARFIGRKISHIWKETDGSTREYSGYIKCLNADGKCLVTYGNADEYLLTLHELFEDYQNGDLKFL